MTIRLVKRDQQGANKKVPAQKPSRTELLLTTQAWVKEFKSRKSKVKVGLLELARRHAG